MIDTIIGNLFIAAIRHCQPASQTVSQSTSARMNRSFYVTLTFLRRPTSALPLPSSLGTSTADRQAGRQGGMQAGRQTFLWEREGVTRTDE